ncbi:MAG: PLP-dependent aminotransferase family protein [Bacillota bacterium]
MEYIFSNKIKSLKPSSIREILKNSSAPGIIALAAGNPAAESFPLLEMEKISQSIFADRALCNAAFQYGVTEGYGPLVEKTANRLKKRFSIGRNFDSVIITSGGQQGLNLVTKVFCNEEDVILCENPSFIGALNTFRSYNTKLVGIDMEEDGINLESLEAALKKENNVKLLYIISTFQNPTGITTSLKKRKAIYDLCLRHKVMILEDNPYGDLRFTGEEIPTIKSLDEEGIVMYCGSYSKVFSAGVRIGFLCGPEEAIAKCTVAKQGQDVHTNQFCQIMLDKFMEEYNFEEHIKSVQQIYGRKSSLMLEGIDKYFDKSVSATRPEGGLFLWCTMPQGNDASMLAKRLIERKVSIVPGIAFMINSNDAASFRLNYSTPSDEQIKEGIKIIGETLQEFLQ